MYVNPRTSASSHGSAHTNSGQWNFQSQQRSPGDVPGAVRNLLVSTRQLQDSLKQWSLGQASETQVSDIYVRIGTDFNTTIHAFAYHKIDLSDIHSVPKDLREVLEQCLAEDPSPETLAQYLPDVRQVLFKLLKGLQTRQAAWREAGGRTPIVSPDSR